MTYTPTQPPGNLDADGLRKWLVEELQRIARSVADDFGVTASAATVAAIQSALTTAQGNITTLQTAMTAAQAAITALQGNVTTLQGQIAQADDLVSNTGTLALTSGAPGQVVSLSIPAGTWDLTGVGLFSGPGATTSTESQLGLNATTATMPATIPDLDSDRYASMADRVRTARVGPKRVTFGGTTNYFLNAKATFAVSTYSVFGYLEAHRVIV